MHVIVLDTGTCTLYETYVSTYVGPGWSCSSGAKFDLTSNALRPDGWTSADAAGLPILPGLVRVAEVQAGAIHHALRFTVEQHAAGLHRPGDARRGKQEHVAAAHGPAPAAQGELRPSSSRARGRHPDGDEAVWPHPRRQRQQLVRQRRQRRRLDTAHGRRQRRLLGRRTAATSKPSRPARFSSESIPAGVELRELGVDRRGRDRRPADLAHEALARISVGGMITATSRRGASGVRDLRVRGGLERRDMGPTSSAGTLTW